MFALKRSHENHMLMLINCWIWILFAVVFNKTFR